MRSAEFTQTLEDLRRAGAVEAWPGYRLADHDIVFEWLGEDSNCYAHWSAGDIVLVTKSEEPMDLMLGLFGFLITDYADKNRGERMGGFLVGDVPSPIVSSLREKNAAAALAWVMNPESLLARNPLGEAIAEAPRV